MQRPITSQIVVDEFAKIVDSQDQKGIEKYGTTIDEAADKDYNWQLMALEETADLQKYLVKRIVELEKKNRFFTIANNYLTLRLEHAGKEIGQLKQMRRIEKYLEIEEENLRLFQDIKEGKKKMINNLCKEAYMIAKSKGWHDKEPETGTLLALIHSEVSEALEADRKGNKENFVEELADVCIRIFDLCGSREIDLEGAIAKKMLYNRTRTYKHGGKAY